MKLGPETKTPLANLGTFIVVIIIIYLHVNSCIIILCIYISTYIFSYLTFMDYTTNISGAGRLGKFG